MMTRVQDLPPLERPREKLQLLGAAALSDMELLAILLGKGTKDAPLFDMCDQLLQAVPFSSLAQAGLEELCVPKGIGVTQGLVLMAVAEISRRMQAPVLRLEDHRAVAAHCAPLLASSADLSYMLLMMTADRELLAIADMGCVLPKLSRVTGLAREANARRIQLVRNGWLLFSRAEQDFMMDLEAACQPAGIVVYDLMALNGEQFRLL